MGKLNCFRLSSVGLLTMVLVERRVAILNKTTFYVPEMHGSAHPRLGSAVRGRRTQNKNKGRNNDCSCF